MLPFYRMDFKKSISHFLASLIIVFQRFFLLLVSPYKAMRKISIEKDRTQVYIIIGMVLVYFYLSSHFKERSLIYYIVFFLNFTVTILFFYILARLRRNDINLTSLIFTFTYTLLPTLIWFITNLVLYLIIPPPRTFSLLGKSFSILFISFSISLFFWKTLLVYLALRFSTKQNFYRIVYYLTLYSVYLIPYTVIMYVLRISRIPFI